MTAGPINWKYVRIGECKLTTRTFNLLRNNGMEIPGEVKELLAAYKRSMPDETGAIHGARCLNPF